MSLINIIDELIEGAKTGKVGAYSKTYHSCVYDDKHGHQCAIGYLIKMHDKKVFKKIKLESGAVDDVWIENNNLPDIDVLLGISMEEAIKLQVIHDLILSRYYEGGRQWFPMNWDFTSTVEFPVFDKKKDAVDFYIKIMQDMREHYAKTTVPPIQR